MPQDRLIDELPEVVSLSVPKRLRELRVEEPLGNIEAAKAAIKAIEAAAEKVGQTKVPLEVRDATRACDSLKSVIKSLSRSCCGFSC